MGRKGILIGQLNPEYAFEDVVETVETGFGVLQITENKLKFAFEIVARDQNAPLEAIVSQANGYVKTFLSTLAWLTDVGVGYELLDYVDLVDGRLGLVSILSDQQPRRKVSSNALSSTQDLFPLVIEDPHLRWALEDFRTGLRERGHQLIFLYRSIEWLKVRFGGWEEACQTIRSNEKEFEAIKKPANTYYLARHAQPGGPQPIPDQVITKARENTRLILQKYIDWLRSAANDRT